MHHVAESYWKTKRSKVVPFKSPLSYIYIYSKCISIRVHVAVTVWSELKKKNNGELRPPNRTPQFGGVWGSVSKLKVVPLETLIPHS